MNQTVIVHVKNNMLALPVTIHWHGIRQWLTPFMDGVAYLSQVSRGTSITLNELTVDILFMLNKYLYTLVKIPVLFS